MTAVQHCLPASLITERVCMVKKETATHLQNPACWSVPDTDGDSPASKLLFCSWTWPFWTLLLWFLLFTARITNCISPFHNFALFYKRWFHIEKALEQLEKFLACFDLIACCLKTKVLKCLISRQEYFVSSLPKWCRTGCIILCK